MDVRRVGGPERAMQEAEALIARAIRRLDQFKDGPVKQAMIEVAEFTLHRVT